MDGNVVSIKRTHFVSSNIDKEITTVCGRTCTDVEGTVTHNWHCSQDGRSVIMNITVDKKAVTCRPCLKEM